MSNRERQDEPPNLARMYHRLDKLHKHVVNEDDPSNGLVARMDQAEDQIKQNSKDIKAIQTIPLRIAWVAVAAIVGVAAIGTATVVWNARPTAQTTRTPP